MNSAKNYVILLLALTTLGGAALAWHQYQQLVALRASAIDPNERAALLAKIADLQKNNRSLQDQLAAARSSGDGNGDDAANMADAGGGPGQNDRRDRGFRGRMGEQFAAIRDAMNKPEVQAMIANERKSMLATQYAALFRNLNLSPDQADKLMNLLVERQNAERDVFQAARDQGVNPRTDPAGFQKLLSDAQSSINDGIKSLLGDSGYSQFSNYEQTMPQRNVVNALQQRLSSTDSPLTPAQSDQLVQILASNSPVKTTGTTGATGTTPAAPVGGDRGGDFGGRMMGMFMGGMGGGGGGAGAVVGPNAAPITSEAVSQAQTLLNQTQVGALTQLQQQQQTAQQIQQIIRSTIQQSGAANPGGTGTGGTGTGGGAGGAGTGGARRGGG